jgi:hypothetical protein
MKNKHIDDITIAIYLGGGLHLKKEYAEWIETHLKECDECAARLEKQLERINTIQQTNALVVSEKEDMDDKTPAFQEEHDFRGDQEDKDALALVTTGYGYPSAKKERDEILENRYIEYLEELKVYLERLLESTPNEINQYIKQIIEYLEAKSKRKGTNPDKEER